MNSDKKFTQLNIHVTFLAIQIILGVQSERIMKYEIMYPIYRCSQV